jgi:DNA-3-methyladenine glycosylase
MNSPSDGWRVVFDTMAKAAGIIGARLARGDFAVDSITLAGHMDGGGLIGRVLVRRTPGGELLAGRIVETEAYAGVMDKASHAYGGRRTERNRSMYARAGTAYVYFTYGMHHCMNVVCGEGGGEGVPVAVLLRALEPLAGLETMRELRGVHPKSARRRLTELTDAMLCSGPARLCQALGVDRAMDGRDLATGQELWVADPGPGLAPIDPARVVRTARVGVDYAAEWAAAPLRFLVLGSPHVSRPPAKGPAGAMPPLVERGVPEGDDRPAGSGAKTRSRAATTREREAGGGGVGKMGKRARER